MPKNILAGVLVTFVFITSCSTPRSAAVITPNSKLVFLSEFDIPFTTRFNNTSVGGLSGIDYNADKNEYYLVCDDRSAINPARFYTAAIAIGNNRIDSVWFTNVTLLRQRNGNTYPNTKEDPQNTPDPEAMRLNKKLNAFVWSSEGERIVNKTRTVIADPTITVVGADGNFIDTFALPPILRMTAGEKGPRQNGVLEGLAFTPDFNQMYVSVEEPLYEDGPRAAVEPNDAWIRLIKYDVNSKMPVAQYAYKLDPIAYPSTPPDAFKVNGIPDVLHIGDDKMLVIERSFSSGRLACTIKVFLADLKGAENIMDNPSLRAQPPAKPIKKQLLLNMDDLGIYIDNVEGVTFGPTLQNGHRSLIFVADNNFSPLEKTQFLLFEVIP